LSALFVTRCVSRCKQQYIEEVAPSKITIAVRLLRSNDLASHKLGSRVGEVLHVTHDGVQSFGLSGGLLEVRHAAPLEGGLDGVGRVVSELEDLWYVSDGSLVKKELDTERTFQDLRPWGPHFS